MISEQLWKKYEIQKRNYEKAYRYFKANVKNTPAAKKLSKEVVFLETQLRLVKKQKRALNINLKTEELKIEKTKLVEAWELFEAARNKEMEEYRASGVKNG